MEGKESQDSIKRIFEEIDRNGDGHISKEEFLELFMKERVNTNMEKFKKIRKDRISISNDGKNGQRKYSSPKNSKRS